MYELDRLMEKVKIHFKCSDDIAGLLIKSAERNNEIVTFLKVVGYEDE